MSFLASQPVSIAKILDNSIKLYVASFSKLIGFVLIIALLSMVLSHLIEPLIPTKGITPTSLSSLANIRLIFGYTFIISLLSLVIYSAMIYRLGNIVNQREDSFIEALKVGLKKFPSVILAVFLYALAIMIGLILLVIPGIILSLSLSLYLYFIIFDSLGGYASLKASHKLVWGHWWRTTTVYMVPGIVMIIFIMTAGALGAFFGDSHKSLVDVVTNLLSAFISPYFITLAYVQFNDLKLRKSGSDLEMRLAK